MIINSSGTGVFYEKNRHQNSWENKKVSTPQYWQKPDSNWNSVLTADVVEFNVVVVELFEVSGAEEGNEEKPTQVWFLVNEEQHFMINILIEKKKEYFDDFQKFV